MSVLRNVHTKIMKAIRVSEFGGPDVLKFETSVPIPKVSDHQVLIKVSAAGINPVDTYIRSGVYSTLPDLPYTPGMDTAGVIENTGSQVTKFKKGDRVFTIRTVSGGYAEYATADADFVGHLTGALSFEQGAGVGIPYYTACRALLNKAKAKAGETVLVHGASGAVGLACVQIGKAKGIRVIGTAGSPAGADLVKKSGAVAVFNHREEGYIDKIMTETGGAGPDVIIEMLSNVNLEHDLVMIKTYGRIIIVGSRGPVEINPRNFMKKECMLTGMAVMQTPKNEWQELHRVIQDGMKEGWLQPHISQRFTLDKGKEAQEELLSTSRAQGKIILQI